MKYIYLLILCSCLVLKSHSQSSVYCIQNKFSDIEYYNNIALTTFSNIVYGTNLNSVGQPDSLKMDIIFPNISIDPLLKRPLIILLHGGEYTTGDKSDMNTYAISLAKKGYVVGNINYRLGWNIGTGNCDGNVSGFEYANYRALQDAKAAIRYLSSKANDYRIDTNYIFLAGKNAGAITALNIAFLNQQEANSLYPFAATELGSIDSASNSIFIPFSIKGVFCLSGGIMDTSIIQANEKTPVLFVHGMLDNVMPIDTGHYYQCSTYSFFYGPKAIYQRMKNLGICTEGNYDASGYHANFPSLEETNYIPQKMVCFFKKILCGNCKTQEFIGYNSFACADEYPVLLSPLDKETWSIYPNPASELIVVTGKWLAESDKHVELFNSIGQCVFLSTLNTQHTIFQIDISHLSKGIYYLKINNIVKKVAIE